MSIIRQIQKWQTKNKDVSGFSKSMLDYGVT